MNQIEITRKMIWSLGIILTILFSIIFVFAYNQNWKNNYGDYSIHGHSPDETIVTINGIEMSLQEAIDNGNITTVIEGTGFAKIPGSEFTHFLSSSSSQSFLSHCPNSHPVLTKFTYARDSWWTYYVQKVEGYCAN